MARSSDPVVDLYRCAELVDECVTLSRSGCDPIPIERTLTAIAMRIRDNVSKLPS